MKKIVALVIMFALFAVFTTPALAAYAKVNDKIPAAAADTYGATVTASVDKLNGSRNNLNISVFTADGVISVTYLINSNSDGIFAVGGYLVYVATYGNTKIEHCFITYAPSPVKCEHKYVEFEVEATCEKDGYSARRCVDCEDIVIDKLLPAHGHGYKPEAVEPACGVEGKKLLRCVYCEDVIVDGVIPALEHFYVYKETDATCDKEGKRTRECSLCGHVDAEEKIPALGHDYVFEGIKAACTEDGYDICRCARCEYFIREDMPALGHDYAGEGAEATCTEDGYGSICVHCGNINTDEVLPAFGHMRGEIVAIINPTCGDNGIIIYRCIRCGEDMEEEIPALGPAHVYFVNATGFFDDSQNGDDGLYFADVGILVWLLRGDESVVLDYIRYDLIPDDLTIEDLIASELTLKERVVFDDISEFVRHSVFSEYECGIIKAEIEVFINRDGGNILIGVKVLDFDYEITCLN